jgi:DNA-binding CsgD family transcriptional regulator
MTFVVVRQSPVMVGREHQLAEITSAVERVVATGRPVVALISGEAGIGKSRLVAATCEEASDRGMAILVGHCVAHGGQISPIAAVRDIVIGLFDQSPEDSPGAAARADSVVDSELAVLERAVPHLDDADPLSTDALIDRVVGSIRRLARLRPVLLAVEDIHWADETTARMVATVAEAQWLGPVMTVLTYRVDELHRRHPVLPVVGEIVRAVRPLRIELDRLGLDSVRVLCGRLGVDIDDVTLERVARRTGGNPFLVEEVLGSADSVSVTDTLRGVLLARVGLLDDDAATALQTLALLGEAPADLVAEACDLAPERLDELVESLVAAGLVTFGDGRQLTFRHELAREVFADLVPGATVRYHAAIAAALDGRSDVDAGRLAHHSFEAHDLRRALVASVTAARRTLKIGAASEALDHFVRAVAVWDEVDPRPDDVDTDLVGLLLEASDAAIHSNRLDDGIGLAERALAEVADDVDREIEILLRLRTLYRYDNRWGECTRAVDRLGDLLASGPPSRARALWVTYAALELHYRDEDGSALAQEAIAVATACGDREALVEARSVAHIWIPPDQQQDHLRETEALCRSDVRPEFVLRAINSQVLSNWSAGRLDDALSAARRGLSIATETGLPGPHGASMAGYVIALSFQLGEWDTAEHVAARHRRSLTGEVLASLDLLRARRGQTDGLAEALERLRDERVRGRWGEGGAGENVAFTAELSAAVGVEVDLVGLVDDVVEPADPAASPRLPGEMLATVIDLMADRADAAAVAEQDGLRRALSARAAGWFDVTEAAHPLDRIYLGHARAALHRLSGVDDPAEWEAVADEYARAGLVYESAIARFRAVGAHLTGERGRTIAAHDAAAEQCRLAVVTAERLGAEPLLARIRRLESSANLSSVAAPALERDEQYGSIDSYGLTAREREILALIADGRTNGEIGRSLFISTKTASTHVSNILRKLGVANRVEAASAAHRHGLVARHVSDPERHGVTSGF